MAFDEKSMSGCVYSNAHWLLPQAYYEENDSSFNYMRFQRASKYFMAMLMAMVRLEAAWYN